MAKQVGPLLLEGTLGGINYYFLEGEALARRSGGGFTREVIKDRANMAKVRESNSEFSVCSKVNKVFKLAMEPLLSGYKDGTLHRRLMQLFLKIKDVDLLSEKGKRSVHHGISSGAGKQLLKDFIFTPQRSDIFPCPHRFDWDTLTFKVNEFKVNQVKFPDSADLMKVVVGLIRFDFESLAYQRVFSDPMVIARDFKGDSFEITFDEIPEGNGILFSAVRVCFYQMVNGKGYLLRDEDAFGIAVLSVWDNGKED